MMTPCRSADDALVHAKQPKPDKQSALSDAVRTSMSTVRPSAFESGAAPAERGANEVIDPMANHDSSVKRTHESMYFQTLARTAGNPK
jgi:hypothetical protein